ncbi:hypothetical protein GQF42_42225 [Streptomyces broussonetiae]|uniref:Uncharacterized protein n=1 Tax=Streptomyces broussonetiae TaxID=2686304 RepID=A0A6I6NFP8_9ACTN|nr:hypothetical protein [Streptomyces broussonetiae]QHA08980.1 hypothetical protein GQF42_42225 [Streptomyces broussonetiae]
MGASMLYQVLEPLPDARNALLFARQLLARFGVGTPDMPSLSFNDIATEEQFHHARQYFTCGTFLCSQRDLQDSHVQELWQTLDRMGFRDTSPGWVETELQPELSSLWPLPQKVQFQLMKGKTPSTFPIRDQDECTETEIDDAVAACGPLSIDIDWFSALRGLPSSNLCGVQLCLNSRWTEQCSEPAPGRHNVYLSIGTRNSDEVARDWLRGTGLRFGESQLGW